MIQENTIVKIGNQKFLVVLVEHEGTLGKPWVKYMELRGIMPDE